jgi:hypothetical protein
MCAGGLPDGPSQQQPSAFWPAQQLQLCWPLSLVALSLPGTRCHVADGAEEAVQPVTAPGGVGYPMVWGPESTGDTDVKCKPIRPRIPYSLHTKDPSPSRRCNHGGVDCAHCEHCSMHNAKKCHLKNDLLVQREWQQAYSRDLDGDGQRHCWQVQAPTTVP